MTTTYNPGSHLRDPEDGSIDDAFQVDKLLGASGGVETCCACGRPDSSTHYVGIYINTITGEAEHHCWKSFR